MLPAAAENSVLPGKISSVFHFHPHISFNIHCKHPIHSLTTPLCYWLQRRWGAQSSLFMNRWWAGTLTGEKCPAFGLFCDNSVSIEGAAGAVQESCGVRPGTTRHEVTAQVQTCMSLTSNFFLKTAEALWRGMRSIYVIFVKYKYWYNILWILLFTLIFVKPHLYLEICPLSLGTNGADNQQDPYPSWEVLVELYGGIYLCLQPSP